MRLPAAVPFPPSPDCGLDRLASAQPAATECPSAAAAAVSPELLSLSAGAAFPPCLPAPAVPPAQPAESVASCGAPTAADGCDQAWLADARHGGAGCARGNPGEPRLLRLPPARERRGTKRPLEQQRSAGSDGTLLPAAAQPQPVMVLVLPARVAAAMAAAAARGPEGCGDNFSEADSAHARGHRRARRAAGLLAAAAYRQAFEAAGARAAIAVQPG